MGYTQSLIGRTMKSMFVGSLALAVRSAIPIVAILACSCAAPTGAQPQKQLRPEFLAVLIDAASKKPLPSLRVILAPKTEGKLECIVHTALTGVSNERGEIRIPNVGPGEYVVFQSPSGVIEPGLEGTVATWGRSANARYQYPFGQVVVTQGSLVIVNGMMAVSNGYMEGYPGPGKGALGMSSTAVGELLTVRVPDAANAPLRIEITTAPSKPAAPQGAPKTGQ